MQRFRRIYLKTLALFNDVPSDSRVRFGYSMTFQSKMASFDIMYKEAVWKVRNLETVVRGEVSEEKIAMIKTTKAMYEAISFFEAYLNSFYSLLQIIAKFTPFFYGEDRDMIPDNNFGTQKNFFVKNPKVDPDFSSYLIDELSWYKTLRDNRHAITHRLSAFLGFEKDYTVIFLDYPKKKEYDWSSSKSFRKAEGYLDKSYSDLFCFLEFYTQHFRKRVPEKQ